MSATLEAAAQARPDPPQARDATAPPPLLELQHVAKRFGGPPVLQGLSFAVARGEVYGLLGPNGCGKSTALNIVCNLLGADSGRALIDGHAVSRASAARIGLCPQQPALYRDLLPAENLDFHGRIHGLQAAHRRQRVAALMQSFGLLPHAGTRVGQLSGGWQQLLNLAVALVHEPALLILDEPTSGVDVEARHALWTLIDGLRAAGTTILMTTHHLDEAERLCSRIGIVQGGRIAAEGSVAQLLARVPARAVALLRTNDEPATRHRAAALGWPTRQLAGQLACLLPQVATLREVIEAFDGVAVSAVSVQPVTLEHAYLEALDAGASTAR